MVLRTQERRRSRSAFTLMEILVVVAIIVVLAALGGFYLLPQLDKAKEDVAKVQLKGLTTLCETYKTNNEDWPDTLEALTVDQPCGQPPLMDVDKLKDPFGQPWGYDQNGTNNRGLKPDIWCNRPGKQIGNWPGQR